MKLLRFIFFFLWFPLAVNAQESSIPLTKVQFDPSNKASLQRGARIFVNFCQGCHSLEFIRYDSLAKDLGMLDKKGKILEKLVQENLIFSGDPINATLRTSMPKEDAKNWFGVEPPDLSLITRVRGQDWVFSYLQSFYYDPSRPWGTNNRVFPDVAMPNVLLGLQGLRIPVYTTISQVIEGRTKKIQVIDHLITVKRGTMTPVEFNDAMADVVNFLAYVAEPHKQEREHLGIWVVLFLLVFLILAYALKKEYWKNIR